MVYIFGHKNPDTDSVCASISYAYLKNELGMNAVPKILGAINLETEYALKKFKVDVPEYLNDVKVKIKNVKFHKNYLINENKSILEAFNYMNRFNITGLPLVDDSKKFVGYVSLKEIASDMIYNENLRIDTSFDNLLETLSATSFIKFDDEIQGYAHAATYDDITFIEKSGLDQESILIMGNREPILKYAIDCKVKLIIMVKGSTMSPEYKNICKKNRINVIMTNKSSFKVARLLCLANPIKSIKRSSEIKTFKDSDYLSDFEEETSKLKHTNYPILNDKGICLGMLRTIDAHEYNKQEVILVDHNIISQSVDGINEAEILEIVDHHNIGDINTFTPINFRNAAVGSSNTVIYYIYKENKIKIPANIAGVMLSGILSDTLILKSPTTTKQDILVAEDLARLAKVDLEEYGLELLESGVSIDNLSPNDIIFKDFKTYKVKENTFAVGQVFTTSFKDYKIRLDELVSEINKVDEHHNYVVTCLFVTNFLENNSYLIYSDNSKKVLELAYNIEDIKQGHLLKNVVSRKKQIVPNIMDVLEHV